MVIIGGDASGIFKLIGMGLCVVLSWAGAVRAETISSTWVGGATGSWMVAENWDPVGVPDNDGVDTYIVVIDDDGKLDVEVTLDAVVTVNEVRIDAGDTLTLEAGATLNIDGGPVTNEGTVQVNPEADSPAAILNFMTSGELGGTGTLAMGGFSDRSQINTDAGATITHLGSHTIRGRGHINASLVNEGLIECDTSVLSLRTNDKVNRGVIRALGPGVLVEITGIALDQGSSGDDGDAGRVEAQNSPVLALNVSIIGGTLAGLGDGNVDLGATVLITGVTLEGIINASGANLTMDGTGEPVINTGLMDIGFSNMFTRGEVRSENGGTINLNLTIVSVVEDTCLCGNGSTQLDESDFSGPGTLTIGIEHTLSGNGIVNSAIANLGIIEANGPDPTDVLILVGGPISNANVMRSSEGILSIDSTTVTQTVTAAIEVAGEQFVGVFDVQIIGGRLVLTGGGNFRLFGPPQIQIESSFLESTDFQLFGDSDLALVGVTAEDMMVSGVPGAQVTLDGTEAPNTINGTTSINSADVIIGGEVIDNDILEFNDANVRVEQDAVWSGAGIVRISNTAVGAFDEDNVSLTNGSVRTITGTATFDLTDMSFINNGSVVVGGTDAMTFTTGGVGKDLLNPGTMRATENGSLTYQDVNVDHTGGSINGEGDSELFVVDSSMAGGTLLIGDNSRLHLDGVGLSDAALSIASGALADTAPQSGLSMTDSTVSNAGTATFPDINLSAIDVAGTNETGGSISMSGQGNILRGQYSSFGNLSVAVMQLFFEDTSLSIDDDAMLSKSSIELTLGIIRHNEFASSTVSDSTVMATDAEVINDGFMELDGVSFSLTGGRGENNGEALVRAQSLAEIVAGLEDPGEGVTNGGRVTLTEQSQANSVMVAIVNEETGEVIMTTSLATGLGGSWINRGLWSMDAGSSVDANGTAIENSATGDITVSEGSTVTANDVDAVNEGIATIEGESMALAIEGRYENKADGEIVLRTNASYSFENAEVVNRGDVSIDAATVLTALATLDNEGHIAFLLGAVFGAVGGDMENRLEGIIEFLQSVGTIADARIDNFGTGTAVGADLTFRGGQLHNLGLLSSDGSTIRSEPDDDGEEGVCTNSGVVDAIQSIIDLAGGSLTNFPDGTLTIGDGSLMTTDGGQCTNLGMGLLSDSELMIGGGFGLNFGDIGVSDSTITMGPDPDGPPGAMTNDGSLTLNRTMLDATGGTITNTENGVIDFTDTSDLTFNGGRCNNFGSVSTSNSMMDMIGGKSANWGEVSYRDSIVFIDDDPGDGEGRCDNFSEFKLSGNTDFLVDGGNWLNQEFGRIELNDFSEFEQTGGVGENRGSIDANLSSRVMLQLLFNDSGESTNRLTNSSTGLVTLRDNAQWTLRGGEFTNDGRIVIRDSAQLRFEDGGQPLDATQSGDIDAIDGGTVEVFVTLDGVGRWLAKGGVMNVHSVGNVGTTGTVTLRVGGSLTLNDGDCSGSELLMRDAAISVNGMVQLSDRMTYDMTDESSWVWGATAELKMDGGGGAEVGDWDEWVSLEVGGQDLGTDPNTHEGDPAGFDGNFDLTTLTIGPDARVYLTDAIDNGNRVDPIGPSGSNEALYVDTLEFADGAGILNLNGLHLYFDTLNGDPGQIIDEPVSAESAGDCSGDDVFDLTDYPFMFECTSQPDGHVVPPACRCADFDADGDVDLLDWQLLQSLLPS